MAQGTYTGRQLAALLGVSENTAWRWANRWHGPAPDGRWRQLDDTDVLVGRAWAAIVGEGGDMAAERRACEAVEAAIRRAPARWVAWGEGHADTYGTFAELVAAWAAAGRPCWAAIDLHAAERRAVAA